MGFSVLCTPEYLQQTPAGLILFRLRVPIKCQPIIGKRELKYSLKTRSLRETRTDMLKKFATTLEEHFEAILAYFDFNCLSTGPLEGTNNKIKTMQRKAYGFRDMEFYKLKIMATHETKYALVG